MDTKISKLRLWISYILQGIVTFFLFIGAVSNILRTETALSNAKVFGYPENVLLPLAIFSLLGVIFYVIPKTAVLGAIAITAWFGGAVATHIIHGDDPTILFSPILFAVVVWLAIGLRNKNVRSIFLLKN